MVINEDIITLFDHPEKFDADLKNKEPLIFLDYDGTLTPIVNTPDKAVLSDGMRDTVRALSQVYKVAVVSGRATDDVRSKVRLDNLFFAGSHGFEIVDPQGEVTINEEAREIRPVIDEIHSRLSEELKDLPGALVEHVKYTISTHYRLVSDEDFPGIQQAVDAVLKDYPRVRVTHGKKVFEIRPRIDWDKGKAVKWILGVLNYRTEDHVPIYIGDDTTDEDAFDVIRDDGIGILVAEKARASKARFRIQNTEDVKSVLRHLIDLKQQG